MKEKNKTKVIQGQPHSKTIQSCHLSKELRKQEDQEENQVSIGY